MSDEILGYVIGFAILFVLISLVRLLFVPGRLTSIEADLRMHMAFVGDEIIKKIDELSSRVEQLQSDIDEIRERLEEK